MVSCYATANICASEKIIKTAQNIRDLLSVLGLVPVYFITRAHFTSMD